MVGTFYKKSLLEISRGLLFLLILSINLREPYFHSRELLFILFVFFSFPFGNYKKIINILFFLFIYSVSLIYNVLVTGSNAISGVWYQGLFVSMYLFLMVFSNKKYYDVIIKAFLFSASLVGFLTIGLWLICYFVPVIKNALVLYFTLLYERTNLTFININSRMVLGHEVFFVWYRTVPILIPALGYCYIKRLKGLRTKKNNFRIILYTTALLLSGTRADMLTAFLLGFFYICFKLIEKKEFSVAYLLMLSTLAVGAIAAFLFLTDKGSNSSSIKALTQVSYLETFDTDHIRSVFFGWGYGSTFYSLGRRAFVDVTELSHLETIRRYGFIGMLGIMLFIWLKPVIKKMLKERSIIRYYYLLIVLAYIFVACTNPYLIDSLGFCVLLFFDTFFETEDMNATLNSTYYI